MAQIFPEFENIDRLKVKPTNGEFFLINWLVENLPEEYEIYFQPFLNGDMPDIVIMKRYAGVVIIEVKDWDLNLYSINSQNKWIVDSIGQVIKSPFQQVFGYKSNMFNLHINGLAEKNVMNKNVFHILKPLVYFHGVSKNDIEHIYSTSEEEIKEKKADNNSAFKSKSIFFDKYEKDMGYLEQKTHQIRRDKGMSLHSENISKLCNILKTENKLFTDEIYYEFRRYLKPPFHVANQGKDVNYSKKQSRLIISKPTFQKIKGVAGSGKTTILAKRAVNAHKRHKDKVLILTYNKTLRNYIRDKISEVREEFCWGQFGITNYHSFILQELNQCEIDITHFLNAAGNSKDYDELYSDENLFDEHHDKIYKYKTILIDEIQDYKPEWIKIIRKYFLSKNGEMVLFGDECQNIYGRDISKIKTTIVQGFGRWERLTKSYRAKMGSALVSTTKKFQEKYLISKYDVDTIDIKYSQMYLDFDFDVFKGRKYSDINDIDNIFKLIFECLQNKEIHPNDIAIISTDIPFLRKIDQMIRNRLNEKTDTTFESEEDYIELKEIYKNDYNKLKLELDTIRGSRKLSFNSNSGLLKLSTVHSFKGIESSMVIYILAKNDNEEMIYTGITRSKKDFLIFVQEDSNFLDFFKTQNNMDFI